MLRLFGIVVSVLQLQWTILRATIDAYGISSTTTIHRNRLTYLHESRSRRKGISKNKSVSSEEAQDFETSTITTPVVVADDANNVSPQKTKIPRTKKVSAIPKIIHNTDPHDDSDNGDISTTKINLKTTTIPPPTHWIVDTDKVIYQEISVPMMGTTSTNALSSTSTLGSLDDTNALQKINATSTFTIPSVFHCTIRGNPLPLRRHRTRRGFIYNPSAATQMTFRNLIVQIIDSFANDRNLLSTSSIHAMNDVTGPPVTIPLWDIDQPIAVSIVFRMKRPNRHFIGNKPFVDGTTKSTKNITAVSRLRETAPKVTCTTSMRTDIDNLAKFVLDSLNNVTYADDKQIVSLHVIKLFDNDMTNQYQGSTTITIRLLHDDDMTTHLIEQQQQILSITPESKTQNNNMF